MATVKKKVAARDDGQVVEKLKAILQPYAKSCVVKSEGKDGIYLDSPKPFKGKPLFFAAVRAGKAYVSFHFFPVYMQPKLLDGISDGLRARMQGKACFNFKSVDEDVFEELARLTERGFAWFRKEALI